jgi:hypothetical protein
MCSSSSAIRGRQSTRLQTAFQPSTWSASFEPDSFGHAGPILSPPRRATLLRRPTPPSTFSRPAEPRQSASNHTRSTRTDAHNRLGTYTAMVGRVQERAAAERQAKLEHIRAQVSSGALVIRQMTRAERATWNKQRATLEATFTQAERTRRDSLLRQRRQRAERITP